MCYVKSNLNKQPTILLELLLDVANAINNGLHIYLYSDFASLGEQEYILDSLTINGANKHITVVISQKNLNYSTESFNSLIDIFNTDNKYIYVNYTICNQFLNVYNYVATSKQYIPKPT